MNNHTICLDYTIRNIVLRHRPPQCIHVRHTTDSFKTWTTSKRGVMDVDRRRRKNKNQRKKKILQKPRTRAHPPTCKCCPLPNGQEHKIPKIDRIGAVGCVMCAFRWMKKVETNKSLILVSQSDWRAFWFWLYMFGRRRTTIKWSRMDDVSSDQSETVIQILPESRRTNNE